MTSRKRRSYRYKGLPTIRKLIGDAAYEEYLLFRVGEEPEGTDDSEVGGCSPEDAIIDLIDLRRERK